MELHKPNDQHRVVSPKAIDVYTKITKAGTKLGDLRIIAKEIKKDHGLAMELWRAQQLFPRLLSILIMDVKELSPDAAESITTDIETHELDERIQLADWLMANQLTKSKKTTDMIESWENSPSAIQRRIFWYHQARLRWVGQTPPPNTEKLFSTIEEKLAAEQPEVQWAMNFLTAWIGVFDKSARDRCIKIGEKHGLYKDEVVARGCTPSYLPRFIEMEIGKRKLL